MPRVRLTATAWLPLALAAVLAAAEDPAPEITENAVALRVNAAVISVREVEWVFFDSFELLQDKLRRGELKPEQKTDALRLAWKQALDTAIQDKLLDEMAQDLRDQIKLAMIARLAPGTLPSRAEDTYRRLEADHVERLRKDRVEKAGGEKKLIETLRKRGQSYHAWERGLVLDLFRGEVLAQNLAPIAVSPAAARDYFELHPAKFNAPDAWRLRRIRVPKDKFQSPEAAEQAANMIYKKLSEGADFAELAAALKYDPGFDEKGGLLQVDGKTDLPSGNFPAEERIARDLKDGQFSKPAALPEGWLIVKREGYRPGVKQTWEQAAENAAALAFNERLAAKKAEFFDRLKKKALIEVVHPELPAKWLK